MKNGLVGAFQRDEEVKSPKAAPQRRADGTFLPGNSGNPGGQIAAEKRNFFLNALREAFDKTGGVDKLVEWGKKNPAKFYQICSKLIPVEWIIERDDIGTEIVIRHVLPAPNIGGAGRSYGEGSAMIVSSPDNLTKEDILKAPRKMERKDIDELYGLVKDDLDANGKV